MYSGRASVMQGGAGGVLVRIEPGGVVVVPAGVGHCKVDCDGRLGIVGAYPSGQTPDMCRPDPARYASLCAAVARVPVPAADPVLGEGGPLALEWRRDESGDTPGDALA